MSDTAEAEPRVDDDDEEDEDDAHLILGMRRGRLRRVLLALIGLLYLASVPWYRATDAPLRIVFGLPDWVAVAIGCYVAVAFLNAIVWLLTTIPDEPRDARPAASPSVGDSRSSGP